MNSQSYRICNHSRQGKNDMSTEQKIQSIINALQNDITDLLLNYVYDNNDKIERQSAIRQVKAYQTRIDCLQSTLMELQGLGETVMTNLLNEKK